MSEQFQNPIGKLPKWAQFLLFILIMVVIFEGLVFYNYVKAQKARKNAAEASAVAAHKPPAASFAYAEGDALLREIELAVDENSNAILKDRSTYPARGKNINALVKRAEALFGDVLSDYGPCTKLALAEQFVWGELVNLKLNEENGRAIRTAPEITGIASFAYQGGLYSGQCRRLIEAIKTQPSPAN